MTNADKIKIIYEVAEIIGGKIYEGYSGRGMYGKTCLGIDCDDFQSAIEEAAALGLKGASWDELGLGYIVYWPDVDTESK